MSVQAAPLTLWASLKLWHFIGWASFGGPAAQIAMMQEELVEKRRWISPHRFLHALNYCMVLPGPEAQQLATYMGWLTHGPLGGLGGLDGASVFQDAVARPAQQHGHGQSCEHGLCSKSW